MKIKLNHTILFILLIVLSSCSILKNYTPPKDELIIRKHDEIEKEKTTSTKPLSTDTSKDIKKNNSSATYHRPTNLNQEGYERYIISHYSELMKTPTTYVKNNLELYKFIDMWYGTPYCYGGSTQNGIDCSAFAKTLYNDVYHFTLTRDGGSQFNECDPIERENLEEGDLIFFKIRSRSISHVAVYLGNNKFVHASSGKGVMISDLNESYWNRFYYKGGRLKNK
jgi:cell wall-associated NlpC family hydrolase